MSSTCQYHTRRAKYPKSLKKWGVMSDSGINMCGIRNVIREIIFRRSPTADPRSFLCSYRHHRITHRISVCAYFTVEIVRSKVSSEVSTANRLLVTVCYHGFSYGSHFRRSAYGSGSCLSGESRWCVLLEYGTGKKEWLRLWKKRWPSVQAFTSAFGEGILYLRTVNFHSRNLDRLSPLPL